MFRTRFLVQKRWPLWLGSALDTFGAMKPSQKRMEGSLTNLGVFPHAFYPKKKEQKQGRHHE